VKLNTKVLGVADVLKRLDAVAGKEALQDVDAITETYARKMANESAEMAPVRDGFLKNSIASSPEQAPDDPHAWQYGSNLPYAQRQEYEHRTHKGFIRKSVWNNRELYREAVRKRITKG